MRERYAGTFFGVQAALLGALVGLAVGGCNSAGVSPQCTPACPAGFLCTSTGCSPQAPPDLAASPDMALPCGGPCTVDAPYCDGSVCRPCLIDGHCPAGKVCRVVLGSLACVPGCSTDDRCGGGGARCCGGACTSPASDANNCGGCGTSCMYLPHAVSASCVLFGCAISKCQDGWDDCDGIAANG